MLGVQSVGLSLKAFSSAPAHYAKLALRFKAALAVPDSEVVKSTIKDMGRILAGIGRERLDNDPELEAMLQTLILTCAKTGPAAEEALHLAQNLPAIVLVFGPDEFAKEMLPLLEALFTRADPAKVTFAACFHEIVKLFGPARSSELLSTYFFAMLDDPDMDVVNAILGNVETIVGTICPAGEPRTEQSTAFISSFFALLPTLHSRMQTKSWRVETRLLSKLGCILELMSAENTCKVLLPICKATLLSSPQDSKVEACDVLSQQLTAFCDSPIRSEVHSLAKMLAISRSYKDRITFLQLIKAILSRMSKHYFKEHFLALTMNLGEDRVVGVQLKFCEVAPDIRKNLLKEDIKSVDRLLAVLGAIMKKSPCRTLKEVPPFLLPKIVESRADAHHAQDLHMDRARKRRRRGDPRGPGTRHSQI